MSSQMGYHTSIWQAVAIITGIMSGNVTQKAVGAHSPVIVMLISIQAPLYGWLVVDITTTTTTTKLMLSI